VRRSALLALVCMVGLAAAAGAQDKQAIWDQMLSIGEQIRALKPQNATDPAVLAQLESLIAQYRELGLSLGGVDPANLGLVGDRPSDRSPRVAPPNPPGAPCTQETTDFPSTDTPLAINDLATTTSMTTVSGAGTFLWDLDVTTNITHTWNADLNITLTSPAGTVVTISTANGGSNDNVFDGTLWDDVGGATNPPGPVSDNVFANLVVETPLVVEEALAAFVGEDPNGVWTLDIADTALADTGSLASWNLAVTTLSENPPNTLVSQTNAVPVAIVDLTTVSSTVTFSGVAPAYICDVNVTTNITHTWNADLDILLTSPAGTAVSLSTNNGGSNDNVYNGTLWDDDGGTGNPPGPATDNVYANLVTETPLVAEEALGAFIGEDPNGLWTLSIADEALADQGSFTWSMDVQACECVIPVELIELSADPE